MKTKRFLGAALIVMCAMTMTTVFTSCGDDEIPEPQNPSQPSDNPDQATIPVYALVNFYFENTADMLKYFNIWIEVQKDDEPLLTSKVLTADLVDSAMVFSLQSISELPVKFTYVRKVTLKDEYKDSIADLEKFSVTNQVRFTYGLYNADKKLIPGRYIGEKTGTYGSPSGAKMLENLEKGYFDITYTLTFDKEGNRNFTHSRNKE